MMQQLLSIKTIPIEFQYQVERPRLESHPAEPAQMKMKTTPSRLQIETKNVQVRLDTTEMRRSLQLKSVSTLLADEAKKGFEAAQQATAEMAQFGGQVEKIHTGVTIAKLVAQKMMQQPDTITTFLPSVGPQISWDPNKISMQYDPSVLKTDWEINKNVLDYIPGKFQMIISQYPDVQIEYLGQPSYVPPSAAPNYEDLTA